jgi:hypothetical protein
MAELADAADSKSAGTWYLGGSTPPPGTSGARRTLTNCARDFGCGLPLRSRPQSAGTWYLGGSTPPPGTNRKGLRLNAISVGGFSGSVLVFCAAMVKTVACHALPAFGREQYGLYFIICLAHLHISCWPAGTGPSGLHPRRCRKSTPWHPRPHSSPEGPCQCSNPKPR